MSISKLQAAREKVTKDGIGVYLPVMKTVLAAIDEHISEDNSQGTSDAALIARAVAAEAKVSELQSQVSALKVSQAAAQTELEAMITIAAKAVPAPVEKTADQKAVEASNLIQEAALRAAAEARNAEHKVADEIKKI